MKVFLLSAGLGQRLRPITNTIPKCLVPINGKPLLEYWFHLFRDHGIKEILMNTHYLAYQIEDYLKTSNRNFTVNTFYEKVLLGSLGTLIKNNRHFINDENIIVCYSDNLTNINLSDFIQYHNSHEFDVTMGLFRCVNPVECGIAVIDDNELIVEFEEKPLKPKTNLANAGIYIFKTSIFKNLSLNKNRLLDIGIDLLPKLVNQMKGYRIKEFLLDIGNTENYRLANKLIQNKKIIFK